jgi:hypothetical protein
VCTPPKVWKEKVSKCGGFCNVPQHGAKPSQATAHQPSTIASTSTLQTLKLDTLLWCRRWLEMAVNLSPSKIQLICDMTASGVSISKTTDAAECIRQTI